MLDWFQVKNYCILVLLVCIKSNWIIQLYYRLVPGVHCWKKKKRRKKWVKYMTDFDFFTQFIIVCHKKLQQSIRTDYSVQMVKKSVYPNFWVSLIKIEVSVVKMPNAGFQTTEPTL